MEAVDREDTRGKVESTGIFSRGKFRKKNFCSECGLESATSVSTMEGQLEHLYKFTTEVWNALEEFQFL